MKSKKSIIMLFTCVFALSFIIAIIGCNSRSTDDPIAEKDITLVIEDCDEVYTQRFCTTTEEYLGDYLDYLHELGELDIRMTRSNYGRFIESVYCVDNTNNTYWMVYVNDELAVNGVDYITIIDGDVITLKYESVEW